MRILFVHQNFPGQYVHIIRRLAQQGQHQLVALGINHLDRSRGIPDSLNHFRYRLERGNTEGVHPLVMETETKVIRAEGCVRAAEQLKRKGFTPDLICAHPGWGESLFLKAVWPNAPLLLYQEFYYQLEGFDLNFDPETQPPHTLEKAAKSILKNNCLLTSLEQSSWNVCPTQFQRSTFPAHWQPSISVIHDGIDTAQAKPNPKLKQLELPDGTVLKRGEPIITFANRTLEPYRGCHTFIRAIPELLRLCPTAQIVLVGATEGVSYGAACTAGEWKDQFLAEIEGQYDSSQVHFTGALPYTEFIQLLQLSQAHVYLTYPFVLSWSLMEAMSIECAIVGSKTAPVEELINHGENGLLVDFFDHQALAQNVAELINNRTLAETLGKNARRTILKDYSLEQCVPRHLALMQMVATGALSRR